jgi:hypothetical protein
LALLRSPELAEGPSRLVLRDERHTCLFDNHGGGACTVTFYGRTVTERDALMALPSWTQKRLPRPLPRFDSWERYELTVERMKAVIEELDWTLNDAEQAVVKAVEDHVPVYETRQLIVA